MKKTISITLLLCTLLSFCLPSRAFTDIQDGVDKAAAESLASIGVVADVDYFYPNNYLKRSEFCKMAVLAAGFDELSLYNSYTLYPDVRNTSWYAPYVNAAVKKYQIIKAYPSGYFGPEDNITYGQAVTILLRMLGWKDEEVGTFWPRDFVLKAQEIGLTEGVTGLAADDFIPRGKAAVIINNMLSMNTKEGGAFASTAFSVKDGCVLLGTGETDATIKQNEVAIWDGTEKTVYVRPDMSSALVGMYGKAVFDKNDPSKLIGFLTNTKGTSFVDVKSSESDGLVTSTGKIYINKTAKVSVMGYVADYATSWFDIRPMSKVMLYRDSSGAVNFVSVIGSAASQSSIIYGTEAFEPAAGAKFLMNGAYITQSDLQKYDVLTYSKDSNTYYVSDNTLVLKYTNSGPVFNAPTYIEAGGQTYNLTDKASEYFKDIKIGQIVTLLLDYNGNICAAYPNLNSTEMAPKGILTKLTDTEFEVKLDSGYVIKGTPDLSQHGTILVGSNERISKLYESVGRLVTVRQSSNDKFVINPVSMKKQNLPAASSIDLTTSDRVADGVRVYEQIGNSFPLHLVENVTSLKVSDIVHTELDRTGKINLIICNDVTGKYYEYGMVKQSYDTITTGTDLDGDPITRNVYTLTLTNKDGVKTFQSFSDPGFAFNEVPGAISKDALESGKYYSAPAKKLSTIGTVKRDDFDSIRGVKYGSNYYEIVENVAVYAPSLSRYLTLSEARANFESFTLYGSGKVCMIIAK